MTSEGDGLVNFCLRAVVELVESMVVWATLLSKGKYDLLLG